VRIIVLGSGSAFSSPKRFNSCYLIKVGRNEILIDCGSDALRAIQKRMVNLLSIQKIFITHFHADHCGGLPAVLTAMHVLNRKRSVDIYVPSPQLEFTKEWFANVFLYNEKMSFKTNVFPIESNILNLSKDISLEFIQTNHLKKYSDCTTKKGINAQSFSIIVREKNKKFYFSSDLNSLDEAVKHLDCSLSFVEAAHLKLEEIRQLMNGSWRDVFLTHVPQELESNGVWRKELHNRFGLKHLNIVQDGQVFEI
jgi:ribonuclease BN (tRNA processing enzyme)